MAPARPDDSARSDLASWFAALIQAARRILVVALAVAATYLGGCFLALVAYTSAFPPITSVQVQRTIEAAVSGSDHGRQYAPKPLSQIDRSLPLAVVAGEDSRFFTHRGVDWKEVGKAIQAYRNGDELRGASTITQQLVKNLFLTTHSTVLRKALEVPLTYEAELVLSKRRILELYLNVIEWGPGIYGAEAAAQYHYGSSARALTRSQAAALAACIPAPLTRRPQTAGRYQYVILQRMSQIGRLPISQAARPTSEPVPSSPHPPPPGSPPPEQRIR